QIIYGPTVPVIKSNLEEFLAHPVFDPVSDEEEGIYTVDVVKSPIKGKKIPLTQVPDDVFSEKMLGEGFAVEPEKGEIYAPVTGYVSAIFDTKHAIGFVSEKGAEVLVHVGIDTVQLNGRHYDIQVEPGQQVKVGEFIGSFDRKAIEEEGYLTVTPVVVSNTEAYESIEVNIKSDEVLVLKR
ncbi:MAG: PTS glucose transporter subunit IIA, partial [Anaerostipes sp.]|nr:PTS glucose transporter subunit IIA [Anaerostipes sp.]